MAHSQCTLGIWTSQLYCRKSVYALLTVELGLTQAHLSADVVIMRRRQAMSGAQFQCLQRRQYSYHMLSVRVMLSRLHVVPYSGARTSKFGELS